MPAHRSSLVALQLASVASSYFMYKLRHYEPDRRRPLRHRRWGRPSPPRHLGATGTASSAPHWSGERAVIRSEWNGSAPPSSCRHKMRQDTGTPTGALGTVRGRSVGACAGTAACRVPARVHAPRGRCSPGDAVPAVASPRMRQPAGHGNWRGRGLVCPPPWSMALAVRDRAMRGGGRGGTTKSTWKCDSSSMRPCDSFVTSMCTGSKACGRDGMGVWPLPARANRGFVRRALPERGMRAARAWASAVSMPSCRGPRNVPNARAAPNGARTCAVRWRSMPCEGGLGRAFSQARRRRLNLSDSDWPHASGDRGTRVRLALVVLC